MMLAMFAVGMFLGSSLGILVMTLCRLSAEDEIREACHRCHDRHMQALLRAGVDTRFAEVWER